MWNKIVTLWQRVQRHYDFDGSLFLCHWIHLSELFLLVLYV